MVGRYFELKCWVYVSQNFQVKEIIRKIIESIDKCGCTLTQLDTLQGSLQDKLRGKRFLIILDDVWIEEDEKAKWEDLSKTLSCGAEESIVVMTTRSTTTSRMMAKVSELQHELGCLSKEDSWVLFKKFAFAQGREGDDISELEPIGKEIVEKCKGLPLAVKTLGSLMWSKRSKSDWEHVKDNIIWNLQETKVLPALKLSYDNLLPHIKRCFAYCCLYTKGHGMKKDEVIQLWAVNGFIPVKGETDLYVIGEEIFNCLVWRSFFQVVKGKFYNDHVDRYEMHDLMNDMAQHVTRHDCLTIEPGNEVLIPDEVLHLSSSCPDFLFSPQDLGNLTSLRSILMLGKINESFLSQNFNHVYLRVLYLPGLKKLPKSICKLKHLKYLNLSYSDIRVLPESITYLQNLQILILYRCYFLRKLPKGLRFMRNLQHLDTRYSYLLEHLPSGIKEVTSLRILPRFPVGNKGGAKIGELGDLNRLEGELEISGLGNVGGLSEAKNANLKCKKDISSLVLQWDVRESRRKSLSYSEEVLEGLEPNPCLERFLISFYREKVISPSWMTKLTNLVEISFYDCKNCEHIPALGRLPNLRIIEFARMDSLKCFHDEDENKVGGISSNSFLCVEELHIRNCPSLVLLPSNLPKLKVLVLFKCTKLLSLPDEMQSFKDMNTLDIAGCPSLSEKCEKEIGVEWPKISHIPDISICSQGESESGSESEDQSDE